MTLEVSKVLRLPRNTKNATHRLSTSQKYCACHRKQFWHVMKHVGMSRSATPATRSEATRRWKSPKVTPYIGTAIRPSRERSRTVANGCATSGEHSSTPTPPEWNGNRCYEFGKQQYLCYMISRVSWNSHDLCSKYEECIDLIANIEGTHQTYKEPIIDSVCIDLIWDLKIRHASIYWGLFGPPSLFRNSSGSKTIQNITKIKTTKLKGHTKCWSTKKDYMCVWYCW